MNNIRDYLVFSRRLTHHQAGTFIVSIPRSLYLWMAFRPEEQLVLMADQDRAGKIAALWDEKSTKTDEATRVLFHHKILRGENRFILPKNLKDYIGADKKIYFQGRIGKYGKFLALWGPEYEAKRIESERKSP